MISLATSYANTLLLEIDIITHKIKYYHNYIQWTRPTNFSSFYTQQGACSQTKLELKCVNSGKVIYLCV